MKNFIKWGNKKVHKYIAAYFAMMVCLNAFSLCLIYKIQPDSPKILEQVNEILQFLGLWLCAHTGYIIELSLISFAQKKFYANKQINKKEHWIRGIFFAGGYMLFFNVPVLISIEKESWIGWGDLRTWPFIIWGGTYLFCLLSYRWGYWAVLFCSGWFFIKVVPLAIGVFLNSAPSPDNWSKLIPLVLLIVVSVVFLWQTFRVAWKRSFGGTDKVEKISNIKKEENQDEKEHTT